MITFDDPCAGLPAPSDFEFENAVNSRQNRRIMLLEHRIERLETALAATIRALAFGKTNLSDGYVNRHDLCGTETAEHLARAAQILGLDLNDLGLKHTTPADEP